MTKLLVTLLIATSIGGILLLRDAPGSRPNHAVDAVQPIAVSAIRVTPADMDLRESIAAGGQPSIEEKYALLLDAVNPARRAALLAALAMRERTDAVDHRELAVHERELSLLLDSDEYSLYEQLRESENEQASIRSFAQAIAESCPLTAGQQHSLLLARLHSRNQREALVLATTTIDLDNAGMEDSYALEIANAGLAHYRQLFLEEARAFLSEEQWIALAERGDLLW